MRFRTYQAGIGTASSNLTPVLVLEKGVGLVRILIVIINTNIHNDKMIRMICVIAIWIKFEKQFRKICSSAKHVQNVPNAPQNLFILAFIYFRRLTCLNHLFWHGKSLRTDQHLRLHRPNGSISHEYVYLPWCVVLYSMILFLTNLSLKVSLFVLCFYFIYAEIWILVRSNVYLMSQSRATIFLLLVICVCQALIWSTSAAPLYSATAIQTIPNSVPLNRLFGGIYNISELAEVNILII